MANTFHLMISTPQEVCIDDEVAEVTMPTEMGQTGILPNHSNIVGMIVPGKIQILYPDNKNEIGLINHGVFTFTGNRLTILSDFFQKGTTKIDPEIFNKVKEQIEQGMKNADLSENIKQSISTYISKVGAEIKQAKRKR